MNNSFFFRSPDLHYNEGKSLRWELPLHTLVTDTGQKFSSCTQARICRKGGHLLSRDGSDRSAPLPLAVSRLIDRSENAKAGQIKRRPAILLCAGGVHADQHPPQPHDLPVSPAHPASPGCTERPPQHRPDPAGGRHGRQLCGKKRHKSRDGAVCVLCGEHRTDLREKHHVCGCMSEACTCLGCVVVER